MPGFRLTEINPMRGDEVEVYMQQRQDGHYSHLLGSQAVDAIALTESDLKVVKIIVKF